MAKNHHHETHAFEPPAILSAVGADVRRLQKLEKGLHTLAHIGRRLTPAQIQGLHPLIRARLPESPTGAHIKQQLQEMRAARGLADMGIRGIRFMPAEIHVTNRLPAWGDLAAQVRFFPEGLPTFSSLIMSAGMDRLSNADYLINFYGMAGSELERKIPARFRRIYGYGAPILGLALIADSLRRRGAQRVLVPGEEYARARKGFKREAVRRRMIQAAHEGSTDAMHIVKNWDSITEGEIYERARAAEHHPNLVKLGFPPRMIKRYYADIPSRFPGTQTDLIPPGFERSFRFRSLDLGHLRPLSRFVKKRG